MKMKRSGILKTRTDIIAELDEMNKTPVDYSDIPPMTERENASARPYYEEFLEKLPSDMVKELARRRLEEIGTLKK
jgi:hypothetical protein